MQTKIFWTWHDLCEVTGMSRSFIENQFFFDDRFIKIRRKVGRKWLFPVDETKEFLDLWIKEQANE